MVAVLDAPAPVFDVGAWLRDERRHLELTEAAWLDVLAEFDSSEGWALDGQLSGADWLRWACKMGRSTAHEKLRVAHELRRRPIVREAFAAGDISYSAVRAITRLDGVTPAVDEALVSLARRGSVLELEHAVRCYQLHHEQDKPPDPGGRDVRRGVRIWRGINGKGSAEITLTEVEAMELATAVEAFANPVTSRGDSSTGTPVVEMVPWWERKADAFMDLVRTALAHAQGGHAMGADRYQLHVVVDSASGAGRLLDGKPLDPSALACIACDASTVTHVVREGEPLALGRKSRTWSAAQRRAVLVRDQHCRFPGCGRTIGDVHHLRWWERGGPTDVGNGLYLCNRHHTLIHRGRVSAQGDANHVVTFTRADGGLIDTTCPPRADLRLFEAPPQ